MRRAAAAVALLFAACGAPADQPPAPAPATPNAPASAATASPCEILDARAVSDAAGVPMRVASAPGTSGCSLESVPPGLIIEGMAIARSAVFDEIAAHEAAEPIAGLGDAYYVQVDGRTLGQLHVARRGRMVVVTLHADPQGPDLRAIAGRLAPAVADNL